MSGLKRSIRTLSKFFLRDNLILTAGAGLGFCSALAVTNKMENSLTMSLGVLFVTVGSFSLLYPFKRLISLIGIHHKISFLMIIVSVFVTVFALFAHAFVPEVAANIRAYIDLITSTLALAFDTTLIALILSLVLMLLIYQLQEDTEHLHSDIEEYVVERFINRIDVS